jgi:hypothetical protein
MECDPGAKVETVAVALPVEVMIVLVAMTVEPSLMSTLPVAEVGSTSAVKRIAVPDFTSVDEAVRVVFVELLEPESPQPERETATAARIKAAKRRWMAPCFI